MACPKRRARLDDRILDMGKLTPDLIEEYFAIHLPYRTRILLAHYQMTRRGWYGDKAQVDAAFEASLITGRMYLNVLGIAKNRKDDLVPFKPQDDDVCAEDLGGTPVDVGSLSASDVGLFRGFLKMVDKGAAHLTTPMKHPIEKTHVAIARICQLVKIHLYDQTNRTFEVTVR